MAEEAYNAEGVAETDVTVVVLPKPAFDRLSAEEDAFRSFVFAAYSRRLIDMLRVVDDVAFNRIDVRLAERLLMLGDGLKRSACDAPRSRKRAWDCTGGDLAGTE